MTTDQKPLQLGLRIPAELAQWLKQRAEENQRSVSNQVAWDLQQYRKMQEGGNASQT